MSTRCADVVRGNVVLITSKMTATSVTAYVSHENNDGGRSESELVMTLAGGVWSAEWDTNQDGIGAGDVFVAIRSTGPSADEDFDFVLTANEANPLFVSAGDADSRVTFLGDERVTFDGDTRIVGA